MRIIDGMHRVGAARLRREIDIDVRFFDGGLDEAFVLGVAVNIEHGLPLTLKDRKAAARRILDENPSWSDRLVGASAGLSHRTVAAIRRCSTGQNSHLNNERVGRDGKVRPLTAEQGRSTAAELIRAGEVTSLREIANQARISTATARDVRIRLQRGQEPTTGTPPKPDNEIPAAQRLDRGSRSISPTQSAASTANDLQRLRANPALKFNEKGREIIRQLSLSLQIANQSNELFTHVPPHCQAIVARVAAEIAKSWYALANTLAESETSINLPRSDTRTG